MRFNSFKQNSKGFHMGMPVYRNYKSEPIFPRNLWQNIVSVNWHHRKHLVFNRYLHYEKSFEKLFFEKNNKIMYWK